MITLIKKQVTEKRNIKILYYDDWKLYIVYNWSLKTKHMYRNSYRTLEEANKKFESLINKK